MTVKRTGILTERAPTSVPTRREGFVRRGVHVGLASIGLVLTFPVVAILAVVVFVTSRGPAFFRQARVGRGGRLFRIVKLRTMFIDGAGQRRDLADDDADHSDGSAGSDDAIDSAIRLTSARDIRITPIGRFLRRFRLDELPQLWNVVRGDMNLVGPRPEVPEYVRLDDDLWRTVLSVRPGLVDPATLEFLDDEGEILAAAKKPERVYVEEILPMKLAASACYLETATIRSDLGLLTRTLLTLIGFRRRLPSRPPSRSELDRKPLTKPSRS